MQCDNCEYEFEQDELFTYEDLTVCEKCHDFLRLQEEKAYQQEYFEDFEKDIYN